MDHPFEARFEIGEAFETNPSVFIQCAVPFLNAIGHRRSSELCSAEFTMIVVVVWARSFPFAKSKHFALQVLLLPLQAPIILDRPVHASIAQRRINRRALCARPVLNGWLGVILGKIFSKRFYTSIAYLCVVAHG
jgi:hypothetical protein